MEATVKKFKVLSDKEMSKLSDNELSLKINELIRIFGYESYGGFRLNTEFLNIKIDGRICADEYEDMDFECPCLIDWIGVSSDSTHPFFHMYTAFSTHYPLASNDKYNLSIVQRGFIERIYFSFAKEKVFTEAEIREINRTKMNEHSKKLAVFKTIRNEYKYKLEENPELKPYYFYYCDFKHFTDCTYSCFDEFRDGPELREAVDYFKANNIEYPYSDIESMKEHIIASVRNDKNLAIALKVLYPSYEKMKNCGYLSGQTNGRYLRWRTLIPYIYDEIDKHITDEQLSALLLNDIEIQKFLAIVPHKDTDEQ